MAEYPIPLDAYRAWHQSDQGSSEIDASGPVLRLSTPVEGRYPFSGVEGKMMLSFNGPPEDPRWPLDESGERIPWHPTYVDLEMKVTGTWDAQCVAEGGNISGRYFWADSEYGEAGETNHFLTTNEGDPNNEAVWVAPFSNGGTVTIRVAPWEYLAGTINPLFAFRILVTPYFQPIGTSDFEVRVLSASSDVPHPFPTEDEPEFAAGWLYKETHETYTLGSPGRPGVPAVPDQPGYWAEEVFYETWWEEHTIGYDRVPVYGYDETGAYGIIGYQNYPRLVWIKVERPVKRMVWHPPVPGSPAIPAVPPVPTQTITDLQLGWNASADGVLRAAGDVRFEFKTGIDNYGAVIGLSDPAVVPEIPYLSTRYAFYISTNTYRVMESGQEMTEAVSFQPGAVFAIIRRGQGIRYYVDDELVYVSNRTATEAELQPDAALYAGDDNIYAYRLLEGSQAGMSGQTPGALLPLRQQQGYGPAGDGIARSLDQALLALEGRGGLRGDGGWSRDSRFLPLDGFASEDALNFGRSRLRALRQPFGEGARSVLRALRGFGQVNSGWSEQRGRLKALTGEARGWGATDRAEARLFPLKGFASEDVLTWARSKLRALIGEGGSNQAAGRSGGEARFLSLTGFGRAERLPSYSQFQRFAALTSHVGVGVDQIGRGRLAPLRGFASDEVLVWAKSRLPALRSHVGVGVSEGGEARFSALRGFAIGDADGYTLLQRFAALAGEATGPGAPGGSDSRFLALRGMGIASAPETFARGRLGALTGKGDAFAGKSHGEGRLAALWGIASYSTTVSWGRTRMDALQGSGEGGFLIPPAPVRAQGWLPSLVSWGHGYVRSGNAAGSLTPLRSLGSDHEIAIQRVARLAPLGHLWSGEYTPPTKCIRYIPRLWAAAMGAQARVGATLPIGLDAVLTARAAGARTRLDAWIANPSALQTSLSAQIARLAHLTAGINAVVAKPRRRQLRMNAWITLQHTPSASLDAAIEP